MPFLDRNENEVKFGDHCAITTKRSPETDDKVGLVVRICSLKEGVKGVSAVGAFVSLNDGTRVKKVPVVSADATLVMRADGTVPVDPLYAVADGIASGSKPRSSKD